MFGNKYIYKVMILQRIIKNVNSFILPSKITGNYQRHAIISLYSNSIKVTSQRVIMNISNSTKHNAYINHINYLRNYSYSHTWNNYNYSTYRRHLRQHV